jgi:hypothetical protein
MDRSGETTLFDVMKSDLLIQCGETFNHFRLRVTGSCMEPVLSHGDTVLIADASTRSPQIGDIVFLRHQNGYKLHRLIWGPPFIPRFLAWRTKADRADIWDGKHSYRDIIGTVIAVERNIAHRNISSISIAIRSLVKGFINKMALDFGRG